jgi:signal transduction histidine kinase
MRRKMRAARAKRKPPEVRRAVNYSGRCALAVTAAVLPCPLVDPSCNEGSAIRPSTAWLRISADPRIQYAGVVAVATCVIAVDFATWIELDVSSIYPIPLVLAAVPRYRRFLWLLAAAFVVATFAVYGVQIGAATFSLIEPYFINRVLDVVGIVLAAGILHVWMRSIDVREMQVRLLDEKNRQLAAANAELVKREAHIAAQNEALDERRRVAEEASGRKTRLIASVSHDIRTPLSSIQLMADVIGRTVKHPELALQVPGMAQRLQANAASLLEVASELIEIGSIDTGHIQCRPSEFDLRELVAAKCGEVLPLAQAKMLKLEIEAPEALVWIATDRTKLGRIVSNLLTNAVKFTRTGAVHVAVGVDDDAVTIGVSDTGIGIAPERLERIFDEFERIGAAPGEREPGWGLGLAICRRLAGVLGGSITAQSALGVGSTFTCRLPRSCLVGANVEHTGARPVGPGTAA